jgi:hypothetical protein
MIILVSKVSFSISKLVWYFKDHIKVIPLSITGDVCPQGKCRLLAYYTFLLFLNGVCRELGIPFQCWSVVMESRGLAVM